MHPRKQKRKNASAMKPVGRLVALFRRTAGLTQHQLADLVGHQVETIASVEQGRRALPPGLALKLDQLLDTEGALAEAVNRCRKSTCFRRGRASTWNSNWRRSRSPGTATRSCRASSRRRPAWYVRRSCTGRRPRPSASSSGNRS
ncbi:helix-turn-helix transcriptional regulator [Streptomyces sp. NPDC000609]|uniref:helix-turn-helix domain-containing protein n=1 Tax=Streptomyces sp. NPDC000609 TaxID=3160957 RepID=UPI0033914EC6